MALDPDAPCPRYTQLYGFLFTVLLLALLAAFSLDGPFAWTVGLIYIAYDTILFFFIVTVSARALSARTRAKPPSGGADATPYCAPSGNALERVCRALPSVAVVIPARNERAILGSCLTALFAQTEAPDEILVVDDGSTDDTARWLEENCAVAFSGDRGTSATHPNLSVLLREAGGKARALNAGWRACASEIIVTLDADTVIEPDAIAQVRRAFGSEPKLASGGGVLLPRCENSSTAGIFEFYQTFEYVRSFLERFAWMSLGVLVLVSGAFAAFRRNLLEAVDGFKPESPVEDYEIIYRLYRHSYDKGLGLKIKVIDKARGLTDAPASAGKFLRQRSRWFAGFLDTLHRNRDLVDNPAYGRFGQLMLPIKMIDALKPLYALLALWILLLLLYTGFRVYRIIVVILLAKVAIDLIFYCIAFALYHRWLETTASWGLWFRAILSALTEPYGFQLLRHVGALVGSIEYLSGRIGWTPQRDSRPAFAGRDGDEP